MRVHEAEINVRYAETDRMGVAHHSSYLLWFELARTGLLRESGHPYGDMEKSGVLLPVIEYGCRLIRGAEYDDVLRVVTSIVELRSRTVTFHYDVVRGQELLAQGWTKHLCVDGDNRFRRIPPEVFDAVGPFVDAAAAW